MPNIQYLRPESLKEALEMLHVHRGDAKILAGGTDLIVALREKAAVCGYILDIKAIDELKRISWSPAEGLSVGAAVCLNDMTASKDVQKHYPILVTAAKNLANSLIRNRATLAGNICNASPGGDMLCPSIVLEGQAEAVSRRGTRWIPLRRFFTGVKKTALRDNEMVTRILFPAIKGEGTYLRHSRIKGHDLAQIAVAAFLKEGGGLNLAVGAAGPVPIVIDGFESCARADLKSLKEQIVEKVLSGIQPIDDQRAGREYRQAMAACLAGRAVDELCTEGSL